MYLKTSEKSITKSFSFSIEKDLSALGLASQADLEKTEVKIELLADIDMLLIVEKGFRGRICHAIH